jgi:hypothetical protein
VPVEKISQRQTPFISSTYPYSDFSDELEKGLINIQTENEQKENGQKR